MRVTDYNNSIYKQGFEDGRKNAIENFKGIKELHETLKAKGLCLVSDDGTIWLGSGVELGE